MHPLPGWTSRASAALGEVNRRPAPLHSGGVQYVRVESLIGRERELATLIGFAAGATRRGGGLLLQGPAGIGKSFVLATFGARARADGFQVLSAAGVQSEARLAFAGLHQLLRPVFHRVGDLPPRQRAALLAAFGMAEDLAPDPYLIALAALELLTVTATAAPVLVLVDDAHWLDPSTAAALAFVVRRLGEDPVAVVVASRDGYATALHDLDLPVITLTALDDLSAAALLDESAPGLEAPMRSRILDQAHGNPLALTQLAAAPHRPGVASGNSGGDLPMTARLERAFTSRYDELPEVARTLLLVAAANDDDLVSEVITAGRLLIDGGPDSPDLDSLEPAVAAGLIAVDDLRLTFTHPLVRSAIYQSAAPGRRRSVHTALADVLADQPDRRVWHRAASTYRPDEAIAAELDAAADRAHSRGGKGIALEALERAARLTPAATARADRFLRAAELAADLGDTAGAIRLKEQVDGRVLDRRSAAGLRLLTELLSPEPADPAAKADALAATAERLHADGESDLALRFAHLAAMQTWVTDVGVEVRGRVLATGVAVSPSDTDAVLLSIYSLTDPEGRSGLLVDRAERLVPHDVDAQTGHFVGAALNLAGVFGMSAPLLASAARRLREQGRLNQLVEVLAHQAWSAFPPLDWAVAVPSAAEAVRLARETGQPIWAASALIVQAMLTGVSADFDESDRLIRAAEAIALPMGANAMMCGIQITRGLTALGAGRNEEAFAQLLRMFDPADPSYHHFQSAWSLGDLAEAAAHTGNVRLARAKATLFESAIEAGAGAAAAWTQVARLYARPFLADDDAAEALFHAGLRADLSSWPLYRARLLLGYGRWLRRQRRTADSRAPLRSAREAFDALGARAFAEQARADLRAAGERSQEPELHAWHELSPQELQIAQLAAGGLTNREIGARLYLSHRTVSSHLYRAYPKLGITSRAQLRSALDTVV
jgi:DNA-binding CsgD family transcriptional regulator